MRLDLKNCSFPSGFLKDGRTKHPVISIVIFFGQRTLPYDEWGPPKPKAVWCIALKRPLICWPQNG